MTIIKKKDSRLLEIFNDLCSIYNCKGSLAAWNWEFCLVKEMEISPYEGNALMNEVVMLFESEE